MNRPPALPGVTLTVWQNPFWTPDSVSVVLALGHHLLPRRSAHDASGGSKRGVFLVDHPSWVAPFPPCAAPTSTQPISLDE